MNRDKASKLWPIMKAYSEGKTVQMYWKGKWSDFKDDDDVVFYDENVYRIKPEPSYRPFKDGEECWKELLLHHPFGWAKNAETQSNYYHHIMSVRPEEVVICEDYFDYSLAFDEFKFADGAPFGIRINEDDQSEEDQSEEDWEDDWEEDDGEE